MSATQRYFVLFTPVGWAVNDRDTANEYMLFGLGEDGYRLEAKRVAIYGSDHRIYAPQARARRGLSESGDSR